MAEWCAQYTCLGELGEEEVDRITREHAAIVLLDQEVAGRHEQVVVAIAAAYPFSEMMYRLCIIVSRRATRKRGQPEIWRNGRFFVCCFILTFSTRTPPLAARSLLGAVGAVGARVDRGLGVLRPGLGLLKSDALLLQLTSPLLQQSA